MAQQFRRPAAIMLALALLVWVMAGCVSVPTSGKVEPVDQGPQVNDAKPETVPKPPAKDASPRKIVDGFLFATSRYQNNYQIAREYLTADAREGWRPEDKTTIYTNPTYESSDTNVTLTLSLVGEVAADGSYQAMSGTRVHDFAMRQDDQGQWRISNPPKGVLISDTSFSANYASFNLYFFDPQFNSLVPDPIYLPTGGQTATALVSALLRGPTGWLQPAVSTAFPARTSLVGNSVPIEGDHAHISLSPEVLALNDQQRIRMTSQLAWTLAQIEDSPLTGLELTVNGERFRVPRQIGEGQGAYVPMNYGAEFAPVAAEQSSSLIGVSDGAVVMVDNDGAQLTPISGRLGVRNYDIGSLGLSTDGEVAAAVTDSRTTLRSQGIDDETPRTMLYDEQQLLRPEYTRYEELWAISGSGTKQEVLRIRDLRSKSVNVPWLDEVHIRAFQISPDGSRMAMIIERGEKQQLALAPILRGEEISLGELRTVELVDVASASVQRIADLGWISPTRLLILGASGEGASFEPYGVEIDGSQFERIGTSNSWGATSLATQVEAGGSFQAVVAGRGGRSWIYRSGDQWELLSENLHYPAFAG